MALFSQERVGVAVALGLLLGHPLSQILSRLEAIHKTVAHTNLAINGAGEVRVRRVETVGYKIANDAQRNAGP